MGVILPLLAAGWPVAAREGSIAAPFVLEASAPSLGERLFRRGEAPIVARFVAQNGVGFVLDQSGPRPLMRFEDDPEIWVLRPSAGPGGVVYYRNDVGEVMLRVSRLGGLTLYTPDLPRGIPCAPERSASPLRLEQYTIGAWARYMLTQSTRAGRELGRPLVIEAEAEPGDTALMADAATVAVSAVLRGLADSRTRSETLELRTLVIATASRPRAERQGRTLRLEVVPRLGVAGRPSSARIFQVIAAG